MEPNHPNEKIFQSYVYAYMIEKGYVKTAEVFLNDAQLTQSILPDPDEPPGFLSDFWALFMDVYNSRTRQHIGQTSSQNQQPSNTFTQNQVLMQQPSNTFMQSQALVQQPSNTSMQNQVIVQQPLNIGPVINTTTEPVAPLELFQSTGSIDGRFLACDISSDGKIVASGGKAKRLFIYYTETGRSVTTHGAHDATIKEVRFHPSSYLLATASVDQTLKLWNVTTHETVLPYREHNALSHVRTVRSLDFHPCDNKTLCSLDDAEIRVWDVNKCTRINNSREGGKIVRLEPLYGRLLAIAKGKCITILDYHNLTVAKKLEGHVGDIKSICWDVNGKIIASVSEDEVRVWLVSNGQCLSSHSSNGKKFQSVIFHPRYHRTLVIGGPQCLLLLDLANMREYPTDVTELLITRVAAARAQSQYIASASSNSWVKIWK